jgi:hypothetical protein
LRVPRGAGERPLEGAEQAFAWMKYRRRGRVVWQNRGKIRILRIQKCRTRNDDIPPPAGAIAARTTN